MKKTGKKRTVRDPMAWIRNMQSIPQSDVDAVVILNRSAFQAIAKGAGDYDHLGVLAAAIETGIELCKMGIGGNIENEMLEALDKLASCQQRANDDLKNHRVLFYGVEMEKIKEALNLHDQQIQIATRGELSRALMAVRASIV